MVELPRLALDISVPPKALARRGGVTISEDIILTFLQFTAKNPREALQELGTTSWDLIVGVRNFPIGMPRVAVALGLNDYCKWGLEATMLETIQSDIKDLRF
ncbi:PREDICTED: uncharacterized protein LOC108550414 [Eufriesea mexicana]|uniref:uncharacterized protein LOC108550414 n=1 Tax=Eufriesea mexicana TaxID=516756 RepID=UPI00083BFD6A|nr:PREDICTED: uncharacterized protein LOC108550414 [Eufriesea mexicana]